jgi:DNA-binding transcriptional MerR regulator
MASQIFTITQLAEAANMTVKDVRVYEDFGLLPPLRRRRGRTDDLAYREEHLDRLMFIKSALDSGFEMDDIRQLVDPVSLVTCGDVHRLAKRRLEDLRSANASVAGRMKKLLAI